ncbi:MAG: Coenzyme F420 hydrogenase/dehydrogenase, beta subunit C-terminal domain [Candidatus Methanomethylophilaceae archaeon]|nr:Coenzyme F420 hydrogenase/dehydrogenase, beta subunit C-terminal domain [Candidatus Methanomethylophilaceae archaeon]
MTSDIVAKLSKMSKSCLGCGACEYVCTNESRFGAITMQLDKWGVCRAVVDESKCKGCGRCVGVCPQFSPFTDNVQMAACYAVKADPETVRGSASGGAFILLAEWMLKRGGYVCGVVLDESLDAVYVMTKDRSVIDRMRGSKYMYSEMRGIYGEVKKAVAEGTDVLFVGLPCQVKAMKNSVGSNDHLFTVDLLCGGQPSKGVFRTYLDELSKDKKVTNLRFRAPDLPYGTLVVEYEDGSRKVNLRDPYLRAFSRSLINNEACSNCQFANTPKPGDVTIGDLWGADRIITDTDLDDGMSVVLANNDRGAAVVAEAMERASYFKRIPLSFSKRFNRYTPIRPEDPGKQRFYDMIERGRPVSKASLYAIERRYDVGITGFWRVKNYGGVLTYYALYSLMQDLGLESVFIEARNKIEGRTPNPALLKSGYPAYSREMWAKDRMEEEKDLNPRIRNFVVGSDQVWNRKFISQTALECYALDFVSPYRNRVSIASSFGTPRFEGTPEEYESFAKCMKKFNAISVRELSGLDICRRMKLRATVILDPVMLCDISHYLDLAAKSDAPLPDGKYVFNYMIHPSTFVNAKGVFDRLGMKPLAVKGATAEEVPDLGYEVIDGECVENWIRYISNSSFVFTDSFHGTVFSILFRKPFVTIIKSEKDGKGRVSTLLKSVGLFDRMLPSVEEALTSDIFEKPIDFDAAHKLLAEKREESLDWVKKSLIF